MWFQNAVVMAQIQALEAECVSLRSRPAEASTSSAPSPADIQAQVEAELQKRLPGEVRGLLLFSLGSWLKRAVK